MSSLQVVVATLAAALGFGLGCAGRCPAPRSYPALPAPVVLLPLENLSGGAAPVTEIRQELARNLESRGIHLLSEPELEGVLARHRIRFTGGISGEVGQAFLVETGAPVVMAGSVDLFDDSENPKLALTIRMIGTGERPRVLWIHTEVLTGDQAPGFLGLGLIRSVSALKEKVLARMADQTAGALHHSPLEEAFDRPREGAGRRFRPRTLFRAPVTSEGGHGLGRVAVLPFFNESGRQNAGELVALHFVRELAGRPGVSIIEPGVVRQALLQARVIQEGGLSLSQADVLRADLGVDLVVTGRVLDYQEAGTAAVVPRVAFSVLGISTAKRQVVWTSSSHNRGNDRVFFFDAGLVRTAHQLTSEMVRSTVDRVTQSR